MTTIIVFASSLLIALVLLFTKAAELKFGKRNIILNLIGKFDYKCDKCISDFKFGSLQLVQSVRYIMLVQIKGICIDLFNRAKEKILNEYKTRQNIIMGHKDIIDKGSVSFYLKKITEDKYNGGRGKIE